MPRAVLSADEVKEGVLPPICLVCGSKSQHLQEQHFTWAPAWTHLMLLLGVLPWLIIRIIQHRSLTVHVPMCERHGRYWLKRRLVLPVGVFGSLVSLLGIMFGFLGDRGAPPGWALLIPFGILLSTVAVAVVLLFRGTRVVRISETNITFEGVDPQFVAAVEAGRADYEREMKRWLEREPGR